MSKTDGQRPKSSHFRFTSEKLKWSGGNMFTSLSDTIIFFVIIIAITLDDFGRNMLTIHTIFLKWNTYVWDYLRKFSFTACPSILAANEGYLRRGAYSRHIGRDKRLTELSAIISQNAKAAEILAPMQWSVRIRTLTSQKIKGIQFLRSRKVVRKMSNDDAKSFCCCCAEETFFISLPTKTTIPACGKRDCEEKLFKK